MRGFAVGAGFYAYAVYLEGYLVGVYHPAVGVGTERVVEHAHHKGVFLRYGVALRRIVAQDGVVEDAVVFVAQHLTVAIPRVVVGGSGVEIGGLGVDFYVLRRIVKDVVEQAGLVAVGVYLGVDFVDGVYLHRNGVGDKGIARVGAIVVGDNLGVDVVVGVAVVGGLQVLEQGVVGVGVHGHRSAVEIPVDARVVATVFDMNFGLGAFPCTDVVTGGVVVGAARGGVYADKADFHFGVGQLDNVYRYLRTLHRRIFREGTHLGIAVQHGIYLIALFEVALVNGVANADRGAVEEPFDKPSVRAVGKYGTGVGRGGKEADGVAFAHIDGAVLDTSVGVNVDGRVERLEHQHGINNGVSAGAARAVVFEYHADGVGLFALEEGTHFGGRVNEVLNGLGGEVNPVAIPAVADAVADNVGGDAHGRVFVVGRRVGYADGGKLDGTAVANRNTYGVVSRVVAAVSVAVADGKDGVALVDERRDRLGGFARAPLIGNIRRNALYAISVAGLRADVVGVFVKAYGSGQRGHAYRYGLGGNGRVGRNGTHGGVAVELGVNLVAVFELAHRDGVAHAYLFAVAIPFDIPLVRAVFGHRTGIDGGGKEANGGVGTYVDNVVVDVGRSLDVDGGIDGLEYQHGVEDGVSTAAAGAKVFEYHVYSIRLFGGEEGTHVGGRIGKALFGLGGEVSLVAIPIVANAVANDIGGDAHGRVFVVGRRVGNTNAGKLDAATVANAQAQGVVCLEVATVNVGVADGKHRVALVDKRRDGRRALARAPLDGGAVGYAQHTIGVAVLRADVVGVFFEAQRVGQGKGLNRYTHGGVAVVGVRNEYAVGLRFAGLHLNEVVGTHRVVAPLVGGLNGRSIGSRGGPQLDGGFGAGDGVGRNGHGGVVTVVGRKGVGRGGLFFG